MLTPTPVRNQMSGDVAVQTDWTSTIDTKGIADWINAQPSLLLLTHAKPDGDALGSTIALARAINLKRETTGAVSAAECWYAAPMPEWSKTIIGNTKARIVEDNQPVPGAFDPGGILITDTGSWSQLAPFAEFLKPRLDRTTIIDHHLQGDAEIANRRLLDTSAAAVVQPVAEVCCHLLGVENPSQLPIDIATPLYVGLATDTGWFKHSNVDGRVMQLAGQLLDAGVNHTKLFAMLYQRDRATRFKLMARALESMQLIHDKHAAIMTLKLEDFKETGAAPGESGGFVDLPQSVASIRVVAILTEQKDSDGVFTKVSLRSKPDEWDGKPPVDVNQVCNTLGGGGHARAAGCKIRLPLEQATLKLIEALP
ncbi:MAG: bifunctional oligoribonuclease/PAP phosphatase NrnA [Phycisphaerales bacterium JB052]